MFRNKFKNLSLFFFLVLVFLIICWLPIKIKAQPPAEEIENPLGTTNFAELVSRIAAWVFNIAIALATVVFLWGGLQFLVSGGNEQKVAQAKRTMLWAAIGLGVCLIGSGFTQLIRQLLEGG